MTQALWATATPLKPCKCCFDESLYFGQRLPQQVVFSAKLSCQHVISILKLFEPLDLFLGGTELGSQFFDFLGSNVGTDFPDSNIGADFVGSNIRTDFQGGIRTDFLDNNIGTD